MADRGERDNLARRPSLYTFPADVPAAATSSGDEVHSGGDHHHHHPQSNVDPEFIRQVDKLADLLPHADREVLAGYLRRSGQDILAIGQYLEDEKNGMLRPPD